MKTVFKILPLLIFVACVAPERLGKATSARGQAEALDIPSAFERLSRRPQSYLFSELIPFNQEGGHIQGVQLREQKGKDIAYFSGSSAGLSYMGQAELSAQGAKMVRIDTLMVSPYRHAGGFQILNQFLAIGIEDNHTRQSAKVALYNLDAIDPWDNPDYTLERSGPYERSTAGAVGIALHQEDIIMVVADWDSRNLDFYRLPATDFFMQQGLFQPLGSLQISVQAKGGWVDQTWHSYQNLNLVSDGASLYMVGLAKDGQNLQVADLFEIAVRQEADKQVESEFSLVSINSLSQRSVIDTYASHAISLKKIRSKTFLTVDKADFRAAAGIHYEKGEMKLLAAPGLMEEGAAMNVFGPIID